jgi:hypothetical protein
MLHVPRCHGCNEALTAERDSDAHIIANALGGRLAPKGILCRSGNAALNELADKPLIAAFGPWPTLLNIPRDRDSNPAVTLETKSGQKIRQEADGSRRRVDLIYKVTPVEQRHAVEIAAPTWEIMRQRIKQAAKEFPQLDPVEAEAHAEEVKIAPVDHDPERISVNFSPSEVFPSVMAALWLFCIHKTGHELMTWSALVKSLEDFRRGAPSAGSDTYQMVFLGCGDPRYRSHTSWSFGPCLPPAC